VTASAIPPGRCLDWSDFFGIAIMKTKLERRILSRLTGIVAAAALFGAMPASALSELASAVLANDAATVRTLLERDGADVDRIEDDGSPALLWAVYNDNLDIVRLLVDAGADVGAPNREGMTPLAQAAMNGDAAMVEFLLEAGAPVNQGMAHGETPLMMAARTGDPETVRILLDHGAEIDRTEDQRGTSALMWAAANRNAEVIRLLLENGANMALRSATTSPGEAPYLAETARSRIRDFYLNTGQGGASLDSAPKGEDGLPEVTVSRDELIKRLPPELVADFEREIAQEKTGEVKPPPPKQWGGLTALHFAVREGDMDSVKALVEAGAEVDEISEFGWTPLLTATQNRYYHIAAYLLEQGADPNLANEGGWSPLYIAVDNRNIEGGSYPTRKPDMDHLELIRLLLDRGANPNIRMKSSTETRNVFIQNWLREDGATPFLRAAQSSDLEVMKLLLEHGADPNIATFEGITPLMVAAGIGWVGGTTHEWSEDANREAIALLLELGNDPNARETTDGRTALMGAAFKGRTYAVQMLVDAGADLGAHDIGSRDTLHNLAGVTWQAVDYADGLVRIGVQSSVVQAEAGALIRQLMRERGMEVPPEGRSLDSICIVDICQ
jgi:ankyrin repeat protein